MWLASPIRVTAGPAARAGPGSPGSGLREWKVRDVEIRIGSSSRLLLRSQEVVTVRETTSPSALSSWARSSAASTSLQVTSLQVTSLQVSSR